MIAVFVCLGEAFVLKQDLDPFFEFCAACRCLDVVYFICLGYTWRM